MRIVCLGGGPAGLYFAITTKLRNPDHEMVVVERNRPDDTFGWGVVLSDETLENLTRNDPVSASAIRSHFAYWDDIAVNYRGTRTVSSGHGFCGIGRRTLLLLLQARARELGVELRFETEVESAADYARDFDLVVAADGLNSKVRREYSEHFRPEIDVRKCKFVWLGTHQKFDDAFTFIFEETEHGWVWAHAYQFDDDTATFIVECAEETWQKFGFGDMSRDESIATCERIFRDYLGRHAPDVECRAHPRLGLDQFPARALRALAPREHRAAGRRRSDRAFLHRLRHQARARKRHRARRLHRHRRRRSRRRSEKYEEERRVEVLRLQSAARNSTEWFEEVERYFHLDPVQFNYSLLTRSQRISHENLRLRDGAWLEGAEAWFQRRAGAGANVVRRPMFAPFTLRDLKLKNRVVVSPMDQYKAVDGCPTDWHFVHYGERAKGGAGLVHIEMTCVSPEGRISPGCTGMYAPEHEAAWKRIVDFVHAETEAKICCQLGHSGAKGSTQLGWEEMDAPLARRELAAPFGLGRCLVGAQPGSASAWTAPTWTASRRSSSPPPRWPSAPASTCWSCIARTATCSPPSSRRSPTRATTNMAAASRTACAIRSRSFAPCGRYGRRRSRSRCASPPTTGSATGASRRQEAVEIAGILQREGVDICNVSAGQTSRQARPVYGRMFQTPFSDRIRNETGMATMAVGNIYEPDHVNSILMAGRADLVCLARPHLTDPYWTLHAAAALGDRDEAWPPPYWPGRDQLWRLQERRDTTTMKI